MKDEEAMHAYDMTEAQQKVIAKAQTKKSKSKKKRRAAQNEDEADDGDNTSGIRIGEYDSASVAGEDAGGDEDNENEGEWPESNLSSHDKNMKMSDED